MRSLASSPRARAQLVSSRDRESALAYLAGAVRENLLLMEMVASIGRPPSPSEFSPQVVAVWRAGEIIGVASLRPSIVLDAAMPTEALDACLPLLSSLESGLIKSVPTLVAPLWQRLRARGRDAMIDRGETAFVLDLAGEVPASPCAPPEVHYRCAVEADLEHLVDAARASLREEDRPDPFDGDPVGFRRWVRGRLQRARVVDVGGRPVFVGYADVRRPEGWLIQGVYSWPECRRRGFARLGMQGLIREASLAGADHVQLAVVEGNEAAIALYRGLGFEPFAPLRTILFV